MSYSDPRTAMPTSMRIDDALRTRLRNQSRLEGRSITNLIKIMLSDGLDIREAYISKDTAVGFKKLLLQKAMAKAKTNPAGADNDRAKPDTKKTDTRSSSVLE